MLGGHCDDVMVDDVIISEGVFRWIYNLWYTLNLSLMFSAGLQKWNIFRFILKYESKSKKGMQVFDSPPFLQNEEHTNTFIFVRQTKVIYKMSSCLDANNSHGINKL